MGWVLKTVSMQMSFEIITVTVKKHTGTFCLIKVLFLVKFI